MTPGKFKNLKKKWDKILKASGFVDIEQGIESDEVKKESGSWSKKNVSDFDEHISNSTESEEPFSDPYSSYYEAIRKFSEDDALLSKYFEGPKKEEARLVCALILNDFLQREMKEAFELYLNKTMETDEIFRKYCFRIHSRLKMAISKEFKDIKFPRVSGKGIHRKKLYTGTPWNHCLDCGSKYVVFYEKLSSYEYCEDCVNKMAKRKKYGKKEKN